MLKLNYFLADIFILSAEKQPIKLSWRKIEWLRCFLMPRGVSDNILIIKRLIVMIKRFFNIPLIEDNPIF